jgi:hypothetical protein
VNSLRTHGNARSPYGASDRIHPNRAAMDFYPTPPEATRALLSVEAFDGTIWEPACGNGAMSAVLQTAGYEVVSTDLVDRGFGTPGIDFLKQTVPRAKHIVTNPPYGRGLADRFIQHALNLTAMTEGSVVMLLDLLSLCHPLRTDFFIEQPPAAIYGLDELLCLPNGQRNDAMAANPWRRYCWMVWKTGHTGRPSFWWLATKPFLAAPS